jgi:hypothetical protein
VVSQKFTDPRRLQRPLEHGLTVVAAHCGTCGFFDPEDYYPHFIDMMRRYGNLHGDTAVLASVIRWGALRKLSLEEDSIRRRIVHGSDYPLPPSRIPFVRQVGFWPPELSNPLELDLRIKRCFDFGIGYEGQILRLMRVTAG